MTPTLSLCMPTNGVVEWVFPTLDSIFTQSVDNTLFEVVITDNGNNQEFKSLIKKYVESHDNIKYYETDALPFINEIESYKRANGELIKYINHRTRLCDGTLLRLLNFVEKNKDAKPVTYFSNGVLKLPEQVIEVNSFDAFVKKLHYWSSWSTGMTIWKADFEKLPENVEDFNELFPHTNVLFNERHREKYVIDDSIIFDEIPQGTKPKGNYDLYYAFGVSYPEIIEKLMTDGDITTDTYRYVLDRNLEFVAWLYWAYNIKKSYCSYDLNGLNSMFGKYYSKSELIAKLVSNIIKAIPRKMSGVLHK